MKKVSFVFSNYEDMWSFKEKANAINVKINPRNHLISGLFYSQDIDMAVTTFQAAVSNDIPLSLHLR